MIGLDTIDQLTGGRLGTHDVPCPECGPLKRSTRNQRKPVLRICRTEPGFATFHCARCGGQGFARDATVGPRRRTQQGSPRRVPRPPSAIAPIRRRGSS